MQIKLDKFREFRLSTLAAERLEAHFGEPLLPALQRLGSASTTPLSSYVAFLVECTRDESPAIESAELSRLIDQHWGPSIESVLSRVLEAFGAIIEEAFPSQAELVRAHEEDEQVAPKKKEEPEKKKAQSSVRATTPSV